MGLFEHFPYTNFHDLNLDTILKRTEEAEEAVTAAAQQVEDAAADMAAADAKATQALTNSNNALEIASDLAAEYAPAIISAADLFNASAGNASITTVRAFTMGKLLVFSASFQAGGSTTTIALKPAYAININSLSAQVYKSGDEEEMQPPVIAAISPADFMTFVSATRTFEVRNTVPNAFYVMHCIAILN